MPLPDGSMSIAETTEAAAREAAKRYVCDHCGHIGKPIRISRGNVGVEIALWLLVVAVLLLVNAMTASILLISALVYSLWTVPGGRRCPKCGAAHMVPEDTPRGKTLLE